MRSARGRVARTSFKVTFRPGWDLLEYVCLENNKDLQHLGTTEPK